MTGAKWNMSGEAMEACSCDVTCPCNFGSNPTRVPCELALAWHIREGGYGDTRLDDLKVVLYCTIPGHAFDGGWIGGLYIDEGADADQVAALVSIFSGQAGGWPAALSGLFAELYEPKQVPIAFEKENSDLRITVPGLLEVGTEKPPHPIPEEPPLDITVRDLIVPFYTGDLKVRQSNPLKLTDPNMSFEYSGRSSLIGRFEYAGP